MSRYVRVELAAGCTREELAAGLSALGLAPAWAEIPGGLMLEGSLECAGEPVDVRLPAGTLGAVEDLGLRASGGRWQLVCGEHDRALLERELLGPLAQSVAASRARAAAEAAGMTVESVREADGTLRLALRPRGSGA